MDWPLGRRHFGPYSIDAKAGCERPRGGTLGLVGFSKRNSLDGVGVDYPVDLNCLLELQ